MAKQWHRRRRKCGCGGTRLQVNISHTNAHAHIGIPFMSSFIMRFIFCSTLFGVVKNQQVRCFMLV